MKNDPKTIDTFSVGTGVALVVLYALISGEARATEPHGEKVPQATAQAVSEAIQDQNQGQNQGQSLEASVTAQNSGNSLSTSERVNTVAFGTTAPVPAQAVSCWFPKKRMGRGFNAVWGLWSMSAVLERDEQCVEDLKAERAYELERLNREIELARLRNEARK